MKPIRVVAVCVVLVVGAIVGITRLSNATQSRHTKVAPDSHIEVTVEAATRHGEPTQSLHEMVTAQLAICRLQVNSDLAGPVVTLRESKDASHGRYRARLVPSMDHTNRRQFSGCLRDWSTDGLSVTSVKLADR